MTVDETGAVSDAEFSRSMDGLTNALAQHAVSNRELSKRLPSRTTGRWLAAVALVAMIAAVASLITVIDIRANQVSTRGTLRNDTRILRLLEGVIGPGPSAAQNAKTAGLILCIDNRIDYDTGKAKVILPGCNAP